MPEEKNVFPTASESQADSKEKRRGSLGSIGKKSTMGEPTGKVKKETSPFDSKREKISFFANHPVLRVESSIPCFSASLFNSMAYIPWVFLSLLVVAQTIFTLDSRNLWFSDEIRHAAAFTSMIENGKWFTLEMNGQLYPDKPPLYFWFLRGLYTLFRTEGPFLYFSAAAISGLLYLWATLAIGRVVGRLDGRSLFAGGIILLCTGYIMGVFHYARMDLLFSVAILISHIAFFIAWSKPRSFIYTSLGFIMAGIACLIKGPLGIAFPLFTSIFFALWCGKPLRLLKLDVLLGFVIFLAIIGAWLAGVYIETGSLTFLTDNLIQQQVIKRAVNTFHHKEHWHYYLIRLPLMFLPWIFLLICLPWFKLFGKNFRQALTDSRTPQKEGLAFLWCMVFSSILLLSLLSGKVLIYYLPILPALALLAGRAFLQFSPRRSAIFRHILASFYVIAAIAILIVALMLFGIVAKPTWIKGLPVWQLPMNLGFYLTAGALLVTAFALWLLPRKTSPEGTLLITALGSIIISLPLFYMATPALDAVLSPKEQAELMGSYVQQGYYPMSLGVYGGTYTYYSKSNVHEVSSKDEVIKAIEEKGNVVVGMRLTHFKEWEGKPYCLAIVHTQWIETKEYALAVCSRSTPTQQEVETDEHSAVIPDTGKVHDTDTIHNTDEVYDTGEVPQGSDSEKREEIEQ